MRCGIAEVIKYGVIRDEQFFAFLEQKREALLKLDPEVLSRVIKTSCSIKAKVVAHDERESGSRAILNYGHTVGHAIETETGYQQFLHGEAVAIGMHIEAKLAWRLKMLDKTAAVRIRNLIFAYGLPVDVPAGLDTQRLCSLMKIDKKAESGKVAFVLPERIGSVKIHKDVDLKAVSAALS